MKFAMFYLVEYAEALALSAIVATVFLSGWKGPLLPPGCGCWSNQASSSSSSSG